MLLRGAVISLGSKTSMMMYDEMTKLFDEVDFLQLRDIEVTLNSKGSEVLYKGEPIKDYDCVYLMGSFRYSTVLASIAGTLKDKTYIPTHHSAYTIANDKFLTQLYLQMKGIPMPEAYIVATAESARKVLNRVSYPIIIKLPKGTHGKGVLFADSYAAAASMCDALVVMNQPFIIQDFVDTGGEDYRAIVAGDMIVGSMKRVAVKNEQRSNIHAGGSGQAVIMSPKAQRVALDAAKALGCDICAVDILENERGPTVLELNLSPGLQGITKATGENIAARIARELYKRSKSMKIKRQSQDYEGLKDFIAGKDILGEEKEKEKKQDAIQEVIGKIDLRAGRLLLPTYVSKLSGMKGGEDYFFKIRKDKLIIKRSS